ncbi:MAG: hypothetical protein COV73_04295 [Candidatus Omnitrophica bacterium CG11_big_fil_rev_8_21_14_0_20_43_6]|nr:MAG: hypothetical protein COV73_04295 [Candidatus Omnitrophica bacterium CG11_big_fil_rev_8_21_14_0_20_43_6]
MPMVVILFINAGIIFGLWVFFNTEFTMKVQTKFYKKINWLMMPISMQKEIKNTRIMALILIIISLMSVVYLIKEGI